MTRLVILALIWGSSFVWIKIGLRGFTPMQVVFLRCLLGAIALLAISRLHRLRLPGQPVLWAHFVVTAAVGNVAPFFLFGVGEQSIDSNLAGILNATTPLWTVVLGALTRTEGAMSPARALGLLLGLAGAVVIFAPWQLSTGAASSVLGEAACLLAAALYGVHFVYAGRFLTCHGLDPVVLSTGQLTAAAVLSALVLPIGWQAPHPQGDALASVAVLGVLCTGIAYILNYRLLTDDGPTVTSTVTYLIPVAAVLFGAGLLSESLSLRVLAGMIVVLAGVGLVQHSTARSRRTGRARHGQTLKTAFCPQNAANDPPKPRSVPRNAGGGPRVGEDGGVRHPAYRSTSPSPGSAGGRGCKGSGG